MEVDAALHPYCVHRDCPCDCETFAVGEAAEIGAVLLNVSRPTTAGHRHGSESVCKPRRTWRGTLQSRLG